MTDKALSSPISAMYLEDSPDAVSAFDVALHLQRGLGIPTEHFRSGDDLLLRIAYDSSIATLPLSIRLLHESSLTIINGKLLDLSILPDDLIQDSRLRRLRQIANTKLAELIDPSKIANRILILDSETDGYVQGRDLIGYMQASGIARNAFIISMSSSNPRYTDFTDEVAKAFENNGVFVVHKMDSPFLLIYLGMRVSGKIEDLGFLDWFESITGYKYSERNNEDNLRIHENSRSNLTEVMKTFRWDELTPEGYLRLVEKSDILPLVDSEIIRSISAEDARNICNEISGRANICIEAQT